MEFDYAGLVDQSEFSLDHYWHAHLPEKIRGVPGLPSPDMRRRPCWCVWSTRWRSQRTIKFHAPLINVTGKKTTEEHWHSLNGPKQMGDHGAILGLNALNRPLTLI